jgi:spore maturation protein CgeB
MRILIPFPYYEDSLVDNVQHTLREMGHEVRTLGFVDHAAYWSLSRYAWRVLTEKMASERLSRLERKMVRVAREFRPDVILAGVHPSLNPLVLEEFGKLCPGRRVLWWVDPPAVSEKWGILAEGWDAIYLKDRAAVNKLRLAKRNAHHLHEAMNPFWHKPIAQQRNHLVVIAGNYYAFRQAIILRLLNDGVTFQLHGSPPPRWAHQEIKNQHTGKYLVREEKSRAFGEGMACLNTFSLAEGDSLNCRAFEIAGAGGLQFVEYRPAIEECFEPGRELLSFRSYEELLECVERARTCPKEMIRIREAGSNRARAEHTYRHRLEVILNNL